ncbi:MAG: class I SAM-dependent methyltransferase [Actinomycetota bacterium]
MSKRLKQSILEQIAERGPMSFAEFMEHALYDPEDGFYARPPIGSDEDFVTSPHVSRAFGELIEKQLFGMWWRLGRPKRFDVIEAGAGDGTLARTILEAARKDDAFDAELGYSAVEVSRGARAAIARLGIPTYETIEQAPRIENGCVFANELLDNLPFHRIRKRNGALLEVFVDASGEELIEIEKPASFDVACAEGEEVIVSPAVSSFLKEAIKRIVRGWVVLFDYGHADNEEPLPVRSYASHRLHHDLYDDPGSSDITAGVDFDLIAKSAADEGAIVFGPRTQREVLKDLGFDEWYSAVRSDRLEAERKRNTKEILRLTSEQSKAPLLIDRAHLGSLKAIAIAVGVDVSPPGFD